MQTECKWFHVFWWCFEGGAAKTNFMLGRMPEMSAMNCSSRWLARRVKRNGWFRAWLVPLIFTVSPPPDQIRISTTPAPNAHTNKTEMSGADYTIWCLVDEQKIPFSVDAPPTLTIDQLKVKIKERITTDLKAYELVLWKVRYF